MIAFRVLFLVTLVAGLALRTWLSLREQRTVAAHRGEVPPAFGGRIARPAAEKAADYSLARQRLGRVSDVIGIVVLLGWTLAGGLNALAKWWDGRIGSALIAGVALLISVVVIDSLPGIVTSAYGTFVIEERFGFNRTTPALFVVDLVKGAILLLIFGVIAAIAALLLIDRAGPFWRLIAWAGWGVFSFVLSWLFPVLIAPLFNKFTPLEDPALRDEIVALLARNGFRTSGMFVMDGSRRSAHGNAYFTGFGRSKRVVFFDTLLKDLDHAETLAVLAHELGHYRRHHIQKQLALGLASSFVGFAFVAWVIGQDWFYRGLGVTTETDATALALLLLAGSTFGYFVAPLFAAVSRRFESQADDFAAAESGSQPMAAALVKLYDQNATPLATDPIYSAFYDSHPPPLTRIERLGGVSPAPEPAG